MNDGIVLSVGRDVRRSPLPGHTSRGDAEGVSGRPGDKETAALRQRVITQPRFGRRCWYCHVPFGSTENFEVHHLDGDHANESPDNVVPICVLCHIPWHLDLVLQTWPNEPGQIIFLPELTQPQLNAMLYALFYHSVATNPGPEAPIKEGDRVAAEVYERLRSRSSDVEECDGKLSRPGLSKVHATVRLLQTMEAADYEQRATVLHGCRYLPPWASMVDVASTLGHSGAMFSRLQVDSWDAVAGVNKGT